MADSKLNNDPQLEDKYIDEELARIDQLIDDMVEAERQASAAGKYPWEYSLPVITAEQTNKREQEEIREKLRTSGTTFGVDYSKDKITNYDDFMKWATDQSGTGYKTKNIRAVVDDQYKDIWNDEHKKSYDDMMERLSQINRRVDTGKLMEVEGTKEKETFTGIKAPENTFEVGGDRYQFIEYTDQAANQVLFDGTGKVSEDSPVKIIGVNESGVPILAAKFGYRSKGVDPIKDIFVRTSPDPRAAERINTYQEILNLGFKNEPDKTRDIMFNHIRNKFGDISELQDNEGVDVVRNLQEKGVLRPSVVEEKEITAIPLTDMSEEEKKAFMERYEKKQVGKEATRRKMEGLPPLQQ